MTPERVAELRRILGRIIPGREGAVERAIANECLNEVERLQAADVRVRAELTEARHRVQKLRKVLG